jgi:hypothetical protein
MFQNMRNFSYNFVETATFGAQVRADVQLLGFYGPNPRATVANLRQRGKDFAVSTKESLAEYASLHRWAILCRYHVCNTTYS